MSASDFNENGAARTDAGTMTGQAAGITIGVTGHRPNRLPAGWEAALAPALGALLDQVRPQGGFELLTGLAAGTDSAAARAARDRIGRVHAVLPFPAAVYAEDFAQSAERDTFDALLAEADRVTELPGTRDRAQAAYAALGAYLVRHADLLLAVWDGQAGRGPGGTADVIDHMLKAGRPVLHLRPGAPASEATLLHLAPGQTPPHVTERPVASLSPADFQALLSASAGT
ncbi:hypothetical protein PVV74_07955 [Roseovarius sp. SK2]|uniref:hypothetical protein n=1 Tax=Roseovarius TaxID=74030 RepID=UPI00237BE731|nr:hypothetical protein [Roseovarius sp. SK2]MDD9725383.1 hypothetical protein [Roseovarius sp. SK2]